MMTSLQLLQIIWFILIGVLFVGYSILDGFDLGIGGLLPFLSQNEEDTARLFKSIGPVWDGNEVWLLTAGGALFAAFPDVYATVFSGFYLALMLVLFALIFRAVSLEFWAHDEKHRGVWKWIFILGSLLPSILFGVALGNVLVGIPLSDTMEFTGGFFTLLRPYPLYIGILGLSAILLQGSSYAALKTDGALQERARDFRKKLLAVFAVLFVISLPLSLYFLPGAAQSTMAWIFMAVVIGAVLVNYIVQKKENDLVPFILSSVSFAGLWGIAGALNFPHLVRATGDGALSLSIYATSSSQLTLTVMLIIALIGMPIVIGYTVFIYRVFKGKVTIGS